MKTFVIIPARFSSTRFPGKPLAFIGNSTMIERVYRQVEKSPKTDRIIVATDDDRIFSHVRGFGGEAVMTGNQHPSGTDRCAEAAGKAGAENEDIVLNIQGDEPFIDPSQIEDILSLFEKPDTRIATLKEEIGSVENLLNPNIVKVINDVNGKALYFSRTAIPYVNKEKLPEWPVHFKFHRHLGIYGFRKKILDELVKLPVSSLEKSESLEQLRWLENGYDIYIKSTTTMGPAVDTPEDLRKAEIFIENNPSFK